MLLLFWGYALGLPRLVYSIAFRIGHPQVIASREVSRWRPGLIHAHFGMKGWEMLGVKQRLGVPLVTSFYGMDAWKLPHASAMWRGRFAELFAKGDLFLAEGLAMRDRLVAIGCAPEKAKVVRLGVNLESLAFVERDFKPPVEVVMMARFTEKKGFPDGLRAFAEAVRHGADLRMTIIGDATDEVGARIKDELHKIVSSSPGISGRVSFTGFLTPADANERLRKSCVFLCPSKHSRDGDAEGGSPLALTQAMALGLLCIGTRHCDIPEVIHHGETGLLAESGDVEGLATLLSTAIQNPGESKAICRRGCEHIRAHFSTATQMAALESIYTSLLHSTSMAR